MTIANLLFVHTATQEDQDKGDKAKQEQAIQDLIQTWLARLQLISVIVSNFPHEITKLIIFSSSVNILCLNWIRPTWKSTSYFEPTCPSDNSSSKYLFYVCFSYPRLFRWVSVFFFYLSMTLNFSLQLLYLFSVPSFLLGINSQLLRMMRKKLNQRWLIHRHPSTQTQKK